MQPRIFINNATPMYHENIQVPNNATRRDKMGTKVDPLSEKQKKKHARKVACFFQKANFFTKDYFRQ